MEGLTEGRIVHYVLSNGQHRPAIVVRDWSNPALPGSDGRVNLMVFVDGTNDSGAVSGKACEQGLFWATSAHYDPAGTEHHTWHWPEKA